MTDVKSEPTMTPFEVKCEKGSIINYDKLINRFGSTSISPECITRFEKVTGKPAHPLLKRGIFFSHRDVNHILDLHEAKKPFYLYTGRGPSSKSLHLGHIVPFLFTKYLQDTFNVPLVIQITNDEKFLYKKFTFEEIDAMTHENIKDIIAIGFNPQTTFIFTNTDYIKDLYPNVCKIQKLLTYNTLKATFGFTKDDNCGKIAFPAIQMAPCFLSSFPGLFGQNNSSVPCLVPCAIDQDPYFRLTRDVAPKLGYHKPALIHGKFLPSLKGNGKMSSSGDPNSVIYLSDTDSQIKKKVNSFAFSGGGKTLEEHKVHGGNCDIDISYQYLTFFLEDDIKLQQIHDSYSKGTMSSGEIKSILITLLQTIVGLHRKTRNEITHVTVEEFCTLE
jgi:tryptophanyl-tRNA synthetase